ncbi:MAG: dihydrofolate reductase [Rhizobiaceae bacterium]
MEDNEIRLAIIAAIGRNGVIGVDGELPWRLSSDLKRFKQITMGKPIIMGRKTFDSIGKPLPGRCNIVITRNDGFLVPGIEVAANIESGISIARRYAAEENLEEVHVIGGGEIYSRTIEFADRLYITHVHSSPEGDTKFPPIDEKNWKMTSSEDIPAGEKDTAATRFAVYDRI